MVPLQLAVRTTRDGLEYFSPIWRCVSGGTFTSHVRSSRRSRCWSLQRHAGKLNWRLGFEANSTGSWDCQSPKLRGMHDSQSCCMSLRAGLILITLLLPYHCSKSSVCLIGGFKYCFKYCTHQPDRAWNCTSSWSTLYCMCICMLTDTAYVCIIDATRTQAGPSLHLAWQYPHPCKFWYTCIYILIYIFHCHK